MITHKQPSPDLEFCASKSKILKNLTYEVKTQGEYPLNNPFSPLIFLSPGHDGPLSMATDMMVWNVTKDEILERMAVSTNEAWSVPGTANQPPPEKGQPNPLSDFIEQGRWVDGFKAQDKMLDDHMEKYQLQDQDWRPQMYEDLSQ